MEPDVILQFILQQGAFVQLKIPRSEAQAIVRGWMSRDFKLKNQPRVGAFEGVHAWAVDLEHVVALHTIEIPQQPGGFMQPPVPLHTRPFAPRS